MNREIKFRAWNEYFNDMKEWSDLVNFWRLQDEKNIVFMQFTGLKDKNGKEIYEGDIVKFNNHGDRIGRVFFDQYECCYRIEVKNPYEGQEYQDLIQALIYEIMGNIYENPELLKSND